MGQTVMIRFQIPTKSMNVKEALLQQRSATAGAQQG